MPIDSLRDGFVRICFDPSANVFAGRCRMLLEGQMSTPPVGCTGTPATADTLYLVQSERDIDCMFGEGSVLSESLHKAFACWLNSAVEIYALPRADAAAAVDATYTITITGTATSAGRIDLYMGDGAYNTSTRITEGMTPTAIAAAIAADILPNFPFAAVAAV